MPLPSDQSSSKTIIDTMGALVVFLDRLGRIVEFNHACERLTGYVKAEAMGRVLWDFLLLPEEQGPVQAVFDSLRAGDFPNQFENHWVTKTGATRLITWSNTALLDAHGQVEIIVGTGIDISERKRTEEALRLFKVAADTATKPFIYLSAGVSNEQFVETLLLAAESGADYSGVLCGRATWQEGVPIFGKDGLGALESWLSTQGVENIQAVNNAVAVGAKPWWTVYGGKDAIEVFDPVLD